MIHAARRECRLSWLQNNASRFGAGKIFVVDLAECIRISSGERGGVAIG
jgi:nitrogen regulatory protein PII